MTIVNRSCDWIRKHFNKEIVNKLSIVVILVYYYIGLLSYITVPIKPVYRLFTSGNSVAVVIRALMTATVVLYSILIIIVNRRKVQWKWLVLFVYILLFTLVSTILSPQTYNYIYVSNINYKIVYWVQASTGINRLFTMFLTSISDFALSFCFLFILPFVIKNKKQMLILLLPIVLIGLIECAYSLIAERGQYVLLINFTNPQFNGYNINIGATFGNKQDWGAFATVAFVASLVSFVFIETNKWWKVLAKVFMVVSSIIIFIFTVASLCKTAIFSELVVYFFFALVLLSFFIKKRYIVASIIYIAFLLSLLCGVILFYSVPSFHSSGLFKRLYDVTYNYIIKGVEGGATSGRTAIWLRLIENMRMYNLFFGLSKGGVSTYSRVVSVEGQYSIHNGPAYFLASYGVFGFTIYLILFVMVIARIVKLFVIKPHYSLILFGCLGAAVIFSLAEAEVLIVSGSNPIFVFNILLCVFPQGILLNYKNNSIGEIVYA